MDFFRFGLFLNSSATDIVLVTLPSTAAEIATARCTSRCAMARGHRLNTSIVLAVVHGLSGLFQAVSAVEPSFSRPPPPSPHSAPSPSLISNLASVDVKQNGPGPGVHISYLCRVWRMWPRTWRWSSGTDISGTGTVRVCSERSRQGTPRTTRCDARTFDRRGRTLC